MIMQERVDTPDYTTEKYIEVSSLNEHNNLRRRAVRDQVSQHKKPDFNSLSFKLSINIGYGPFVEETYGDPGIGHTFLHLDLLSRTADITFLE